MTPLGTTTASPREPRIWSAPEIGRLGERLAADPARRARLAAAKSPEGLVHAVAAVACELGVSSDRRLWADVVEIVLRVDESLLAVKPKVNVKLSDFGGLARVQLLALWLAAKIAAPFDTRWFHKPFPRLRAWLRRRPRQAPGMADGATVRPYSAGRLAALRATFDRQGDQLCATTSTGRTRSTAPRSTTAACTVAEWSPAISSTPLPPTTWSPGVWASG